MKIGIFFSVDKSWGGVYQYALTLLESLLKIPGHSYTIIATTKDIPAKIRTNKRVKVVEFHDSQRSFIIKIRDFVSLVVGATLPRFIPFLYKHGLFWLITGPDKWSNKGYMKAIEDAHVDLMIYPTSIHLSFLSPVPSVVAIHDLNHRINPQFPEVASGGRFEIREYGFSHMAKYSRRILVDSAIGKQDVLDCYPSTDPNKIVILPFLPPSYLNTKITKMQATKLLKKYKITAPYFYYPAKFWPHKHHLDLIEALHLAHVAGNKFHLVFTGSAGAEFDTLPRVRALAHTYGLDKYVHYLGFVDDENVVSALYKQAVALIMPTHFGPTNIPILEAWAIGTPVIYSNVRGCKEQLGNAGIGVNPDSPQEMARAMQKMGGSATVHNDYSKKGRIRLSKWTTADFAQQVKDMINHIPLS